MEQPSIISNKIRTPDGTVIESMHRHDYVSHTDKNGYVYSVDGGKSYLKRSYSPGAPAAQEASVYSNEPHELIRESFKWGTRGIDGNDPLTWICLSEMTTEHIDAVLETQTLLDHISKIFNDELVFREENYN